MNRDESMTSMTLKAELIVIVSNDYPRNLDSPLDKILLLSDESLFEGANRK